MPTSRRQMIPDKANSWGYLIIWEFRIRPRMRKRFLAAYGPHGEWQELFARDKHYFGTELIHHLKAPHKFWTLDYWTSRRAYEHFKKLHSEEYRQIDAECAHLTVIEREIGTFTRTRRP